MPAIRIGAWNVCIVVLGVPGTGKSTWAAAKVLSLARAPAYVLAHDPGWRIPSSLPNGNPVPIYRHDSIAATRAALTSQPAGIHALAVADGGAVLALAEETATAARRGDLGTPVVVLLDEGVGASGASPYRLGPEFREFLALRRHKHVGLIINAQDPSLLHYGFLSLSTELVLFRLRDERALSHLARVGVSREILEKLPTLPNYHHIDVKLG